MINDEKKDQPEEEKKAEEKKKQQSEQVKPTIQKGDPKPTESDLPD